MWGGSTRIMEAEGTCMISARRFTISCHFRMISEGTSIGCATLEAVILRLRSGPFSVDTLVHAEQFLGLVGEGSRRAPAAACDSLFDHFAARASNAAGISRPRESAVEVSQPIRPPSFSGSLQGRDVGQSGFECELALFGAEADAFNTYERGVADADEPEETRQ